MSYVDHEAIQNIRVELEKVSALVLTARRLLAGGALVDLVAIEERVRVVCQSIEAMSREDGQTLYADVQALAKRLDSLEEDLRHRMAGARPVVAKEGANDVAADGTGS